MTRSSLHLRHLWYRIQRAVELLPSDIRCWTCWNFQLEGTYRRPYITEVFKSAQSCDDCRLLAIVLSPYKSARFKDSRFSYRFENIPLAEFSLLIEIILDGHNARGANRGNIRLEVFADPGMPIGIYCSHIQHLLSIILTYEQDLTVPGPRYWKGVIYPGTQDLKKPLGGFCNGSEIVMAPMRPATATFDALGYQLASWSLTARTT